MITSHIEACHIIEDAVVARFSVDGTHRQRAFQLACKVKSETLIQALFDGSLVLAIPVLFLSLYVGQLVHTWKDIIGATLVAAQLLERKTRRQARGE